jgi:hypothetical protein
MGKQAGNHGQASWQAWTLWHVCHTILTSHAAQKSAYKHIVTASIVHHMLWQDGVDSVASAGNKMSHASSEPG